MSDIQKLPSQVILQNEIASDEFRIIETTDSPDAKRVVSKVIIGDNSINFLTVWEGDEYDNIGQWTDDLLTTAISQKILASFRNKV